MTTKIVQGQINHLNSNQKEKETQTWENKVWETGKEVALTSLPFLTLYKPLSFPVALGTGALRVGISAFNLAAAIREGDSKEILSEFFRTTVAVISLAGTLFAHPLGLLISTTYDLILELNTLYNHLKEGRYKETIQSAFKILGHCLYLGVFIYGGPEIAICFFAVQILTALFEAHDEFKEGRYIAATGHMLMSLLRGGQLAGQVKALQFKLELKRVLSDSNYVGVLGDKWQFPSDHLPVGAQVGNAHVISWNILNNQFMAWVIDQDSQGLNGSMITQLNEKPSVKFPGLTMRDELVMTYLLQIMNNPAHSSHLILSLQECNPLFIKAFRTMLPGNMGMVLSDKTLSAKDQNITIYNKETFTFAQNQSSIAHAFPNSDPRRTLMDLVFVENATQEKFQIINAHLPGDPFKPGKNDFAKYVLTHMRSDCTNIALGDMNFTEADMQLAFNEEAAEFNIPLPFKNLVHYNTNIGAFTFDGKGIDHVWVNTKLPTKGMSPNEVLPGLQTTVDLLHPNGYKTYWKIQEAHKLEDLKKQYLAAQRKAQELQLASNLSERLTG